MQASVGQVEAAQSLMSEYIRAQLRYGWLPEQIHYHLDAVRASCRVLCMLWQFPPRALYTGCA